MGVISHPIKYTTTYMCMPHEFPISAVLARIITMPLYPANFDTVRR